MISQTSLLEGRRRRRCGPEGRRRSSSAVLPRAALWLALLLPAVAADWRICDEGVFAVDGGGAEPEVARRGAELTFTIQGTLDRNVTGGVLECWVDYLGFHVYSKTGDLCEAVPCPLAAGRHTLRLRQRLPSVAPPGPYLGVFQATASDGVLLFCVDLNFRVSMASGGQGDEAAAAAAAA